MNNTAGSETALQGRPLAVSTLPSQRVILLTFDRLSAHSLSTFAPSAELPDPDGFQRLELQATFFEQHYSQDLRSAAFDFRTFGTTADFAGLEQRLQAAGIRQRRLIVRLSNKLTRSAVTTITEDGEGIDDLAGNFSRFEWCPAISQLEIDDLANRQFIWIHACREVGAPGHASQSANSGSQKNLGSIVEDVLELRDQLSPGDGLPAALIVTAIRGGTKMPGTPFQSRLAEDEVRVPLWIDPGQHEFCRVGSISGSRDVLPTVAELLGLGTPAEISAVVDEAVPANATISRSRSLLPLCGKPGVATARLVVIRTKNHDAVRTDQFLLVRGVTAEPCGSAAGDRPKPTVESGLWLYVKPEDFWNVHDQAGVYENVVHELYQHLP